MEKKMNGGASRNPSKYDARLKFGTGGIRGIMGGDAGQLNTGEIARTSFGLADFLLHRYAGKAQARGVVIAFDTRMHSEEFARCAAACYNVRGIRTFLFDRVTPTPVLSFAVRYLNCVAGIVITASHNPKEYNGYKVYNEDGYQITLADAKDIADCIERVEDDLMPHYDIERGGICTTVGDDVLDEFLQAMLKCRLRPVQESAPLKIAYSSLHGAGLVPVTRALNLCGYSVSTVKEQESFDGAFSTVESPNPEEASALSMVLKLAEEQSAELALATDPDSDRIGAAVLYKGEYRLLSGNQIGALLVDYIITRRKQLHTLAPDATVIKTIVTSDLGAKIAQSNGISVLETLTGFKFIGENISEFSRSRERSFLFGYEESYGFLIGDYARDKDAVGAAVMLCDMAAYHHANGVGVYERLEQLYMQYGFYLDSLDSFAVEPGRVNTISTVMHRFRSLKENGIAAILDYASGVAGFPKSDVLKFLYADGSWFAVRPSGTEPKLKVYYSAMGITADTARIRLSDMRALTERIIKQ